MKTLSKKAHPYMRNNQNNKRRKLSGEWFTKAQEDELSAKDILQDRQGAPGTVCFLSQQMAEKYLKGYLVYKGKRFPKIHQLDRLTKLCEGIELDFQEIKEESEFLSAFYITTRYPGDYPQFSFKQAEEAFEKASKIKKFVLAKIK